jgi:hypothetical protein
MTKTEAIALAARELIAHGGPACLTDPHIALRAMDDAMALGGAPPKRRSRPRCAASASTPTPDHTPPRVHSP